jgi:Site-specific recombinases, DNA invertase Pin homologs
MLADVESKKFNIIMAKELSRLARNGELSYKILNEVQSNSQLDLVTLDGAVNTIKDQTQLFGLYAWVYEHESATMSRRIKSVFVTKAKSGEFKGSIPPYGYRKENKHLVIRNDFTVDVIKSIFRSYIEGVGFDKIARKLLEAGTPSPAQVAGKRNAGRVWHGSTVKDILMNPHYCGNLVQHRETTISVTSTKRKKCRPDEMILVENTHKPIITKTDFDLVQQLIKQRARKHSHQKVHLFTNVVFCNDCGKGMHFKKNRRGYICGNYDKHGHSVCSDHLIHEQDLIDIITNDIAVYYSKISSEQFKDKLQRKMRMSETKNLSRLSQIKNNIEKLSKKKNALRLMIRNEISSDNYSSFVRETDEEIAKLTTEKEKINISECNKVNDERFNELFKKLEQFIKCPTLDKEILHRLIERINGSPIIYYRFSDPHQSSIFFQATHTSRRAMSVGTCRPVGLF